jgi:glycosyltransferase involved in cell wall biosynthesis
MRIAYVAAAQIPSTRANSIQVMKVCQALQQNGQEVRLYVPGKTQFRWETLQHQYGLNTMVDVAWIDHWRFLRYLDFTFKALTQARNWHADLVYTRMLQVARSAALSGMPVILELHDVPSGRFGPSRLRDFLCTPVHKRVVFITHSLRRLIEDQLAIEIPEEEVIIAPDGVDLERYSQLPSPSEARQSLGLIEKITALYSGSFYQGRGLQTLFDLAGMLREMQFVWVGGAPEEVSTWKQKLKSTGIENVMLTGYVNNSELPRYQAAADLLLMPYSRNVAGSSGGNIANVTSPMKLFEYMACGRAIVTTDLPVLHEVLNDQNAVFCPPDDLQTWKSTLQALAEDDKKRQALGKQALMDVQQYSWRNRMRQIMDGWTTLQ